MCFDCIIADERREVLSQHAVDACVSVALVPKSTEVSERCCGNRRNDEVESERC